MKITESAIKQINTHREKENNAKLMLRVTILGGGCSGFKYELDFDDQQADDDKVFENVVISDDQSLEFIKDAVIDYERNLMKSRFTVKNPQATASCGCGKSFSVDM